MGRAALALLTLLPLATGCVYLNGLYNAQRLYDEAERLSRQGRRDEARERYAQVVEKAARGYRSEEGGRWADDAAYLAGRAYLRQGDVVRARSAFERTLATTESEDLRLGATLYLGATAIAGGDPARGIALLNEALRALGPGSLRSEGHLWRARALLATGRVDAGWWDLDRAGEEHSDHRVAADLERLVWGVVHADSARARRGARVLLASPEGAGQVDTLHALVEAAQRAWGPAAAAALLDGAEEAPWPTAERDRTLLLRASLRVSAGDTAAAVRDADRVSRGTGASATRARLWVAGLRLSTVERVEELDELRPLLLPAVGDPDVLRLLEALRKMELLERRAVGEDRRVALFAAAELARDDLEALRLARGLFLRYASLEEASPWAGKAMLAALALTPPGPEREALLVRVGTLRDDPYVSLAMRGAAASQRYEALEHDLHDALALVVAEVAAEAAERDVMARDRSDTLPRRRR